MSDSVYVTIYNKLNESTIETVKKVLAEVSKAIGPTLTIAMALYVVIYGIMIIRGDVQEPVQDFAKRCLKLAIIWGAVMGTDVFMDYFGNIFFTHLPKEITAALGGDPKLTPVNQLESMTGVGFKAADRLAKGSGWFGWSQYLLAGLVYLCTAFAGAAGIFILCLAKIGLSMLLVLGPIFICFMMFELTNRWFWSWVSSLLSFVFLQVLLISLLVIITAIVQKMSLDPKTNSTVAGAFSLIILYTVALFILKELFGVSSSLSGGLSMDLRSYGRQIANGAGMALGATKAAGGAIMSTGRAAGGAIMSTGRFAAGKLSGEKKSPPETKKPPGKTSGSPPNSGKDSPSDSPQGSGKGDKIYSNSLSAAGGAMATGDAGGAANAVGTFGSIQDVRTAAKSMERSSSQQQQQARTQRQAQQHQEQAKITSGAASAPSPSAVTAAPSSAGGSSGASSGSSGASGSSESSSSSSGTST